MKRNWMLAVLVTGLAFGVGCSTDTESGKAQAVASEKETLVVWKQVKHATGNEELVNKEVHEVAPSQTTSEKISLIFNLLKTQKAGSDLLPTVPENVQLLHAEIKNSVLTLNFSNDISKLNEKEQGIFIKSLNNSMIQNFSKSPETEFKKIDYLINGKSVKTLAENEFTCNKGETCWEPFLSNTNT